MEKVFEDEFMEVQSRLISLCLELLKIGKQQMDQVYVYCNLERCSTLFDAFFVKNNKVVQKEKVGAGWKTVINFLKIGINEAEKIRKVCKDYGKTVPDEIKMIYDIRSGKFQTEYGYEERTQIEEKSAAQLVDDWTEEVERSLAGS